MAYIHTTFTVLNRCATEVLDRLDKLEDVLIVECPVEEEINRDEKTFLHGASTITLLHDTSLYHRVIDELLLLLAESKVELVACTINVNYRMTTGKPIL
jgi:hypothetical protein